MSAVNVLVVDDDAMQRKLTCLLLRHEGYGVSEAADAREGLVIAHARPPRLVISDILMPTILLFCIVGFIVPAPGGTGTTPATEICAALAKLVSRAACGWIRCSRTPQ